MDASDEIVSTMSSARCRGSVERFAHLGDAAHDAGRGLVVHDADRLDRVRPVLGEPRLDRRGIGAATPIRRQHFGHEAEPRGHLTPERSEPPRLAHQNAVAGRQRVHERGFPGARARSRIDDHRRGGLEDRSDLGEHLTAERAELGAAMIDGRLRDRAQHAIGDIGRARDLEEVSAARVAHRLNIYSRGARAASLSAGRPLPTGASLPLRNSASRAAGRDLHSLVYNPQYSAAETNVRAGGPSESKPVPNRPVRRSPQGLCEIARPQLRKSGRGTGRFVR